MYLLQVGIVAAELHSNRLGRRRERRRGCGWMDTRCIDHNRYSPSRLRMNNGNSSIIDWQYNTTATSIALQIHFS